MSMARKRCSEGRLTAWGSCSEHELGSDRVNSATIPCEAANAVQAGVEKGLVVGRFLVVEPTGLEPVTPCLQRPGAVLIERCCRTKVTAMDAHDTLSKSVAAAPYCCKYGVARQMPARRAFQVREPMFWTVCRALVRRWGRS